MTLKEKLNAIRDAIQIDPGNRGLKKIDKENLITASWYDFAAACQTFAATKSGTVAIVTGFTIASVDPPRAETDGPPGAIFLARALHHLGLKVHLITDRFCINALDACITTLGLSRHITVHDFPMDGDEHDVNDLRSRFGPLTHLISIERVGPSHNPESVAGQLEGSRFVMERFRETVAPVDFDRCHNSRARDITELTAPLHLLWEADYPRLAEITIGIGDGGNEIGMGKIAWETIHRNIPQGGVLACRIPCDQQIVCGVSNWGGYALAAGISLVRATPIPAEWWNPEREKSLLQLMIKAGPLVDGLTGEMKPSVDGLDFDEYWKPIEEIRKICES
jgi:D-glutamate cyclase